MFLNVLGYIKEFVYLFNSEFWDKLDFTIPFKVHCSQEHSLFSYSSNDSKIISLKAVWSWNNLVCSLPLNSFRLHFTQNNLHLRDTHSQTTSKHFPFLHSSPNAKEKIWNFLTTTSLFLKTAFKLCFEIRISFA